MCTTPYHFLRCRVWDYPIKEQYTSIYKVLVINNNKKTFSNSTTTWWSWPGGKFGIMLLCNDGFDHHRGPGDQQDGHGGHLWGGLPTSPRQHRCNCFCFNFSYESIFICPSGPSDREKNEKDLHTVLEDRHTAIIFLSFCPQNLIKNKWKIIWHVSKTIAGQFCVHPRRERGQVRVL